MEEKLDDFQKINKQYLLLKVLFFTRYFGDSLFYSFFNIFLAYKGLTEDNIGIVAAITPIVTLLCNPIWNLVCKNVNTNRNVMKIVTVIEGVIIILIANLSGFETFAILAGILAIVASPFYILLDGFSGTFSNANNKRYSPLRMMGSLAYVAGTAIGGVLIQFAGFEWVFIISGFFFTIVSVIIFFVNPIKISKNENIKPKRDYKAVLTNKTFYFYMLFYLFTVTIGVLGDTFFGVYLQKMKDISSMQFGFIQSGTMLLEATTIFVLSRVDGKFKDSSLYIFAGCCYFIRLLLIGLDLPVIVIILAALSRGIAWGTILSIHVNHLIKIVKVENVTVALFIFSLVSAILSSIGNTLCGKVIMQFGYNAYYLSLGLIALGATVIYIFVNLIKKGKKCKTL